MRRSWFSAARCRWLSCLWLLLALPSCVVFHDRAGVPVDPDVLDAIVVGETERFDVLALLGAPSGTYDADLLATLMEFGGTERPSGTPELMHPSVATWQQVDIRGRAMFFPILFFVGSSEISSRTAMVFFDDHDVVSAVAYREDLP